jgi:two-component system, NarL family, invasion response regulator UvrY
MKVLLADDHVIMREGLKQILSDEFPRIRYGESASTDQTLRLLREQRWDILILDIFMPGRGGLEVLQEARRDYPSLPVLVLSSAPEDQLALRVLKAGANGYLNKQVAPENLVLAVKKVLTGGKYVSAALAEQLADEIGLAGKNPLEKLSHREYEVMQLLVGGKTLKEIADELALSAKTISTYHMRIMNKLHVKNDVELFHYVHRHRLVENLN